MRRGSHVGRRTENGRCSVKRLVASALAAGVAAAMAATPAFGSSHRESPLMTQDPEADLTDVYAWVDQHDPGMVNLVMAAVPLENPQDAPNYYEFSGRGRTFRSLGRVLYDVNVDR